MLTAVPVSAHYVDGDYRQNVTSCSQVETENCSADAPDSNYQSGETSTQTGSTPAERFVGCESGGDWNAVNPESGAYGRYQLMPFHWSSGVCRGLGKGQSGQTECATRVYESQGSGAWSQCGG